MSKLRHIKQKVEESQARNLSKSQPTSHNPSPVHTPTQASPSFVRNEPVQTYSVEEDREIIVGRRKLAIEQEKLKTERDTLEAEKEALRISKERLEIEKIKQKINEDKEREKEKSDIQKELKEEKQKLAEQMEQLRLMTESMIQHKKLNEIVLVKDERTPDISGEIEHMTRIIEQINNTVSKATDFVEQREAAITGEINDFTAIL